MFLLEEATAPDHETFASFKSLHFATCAEEIFRLNNEISYVEGVVKNNHYEILVIKLNTWNNWNTLENRICLHNWIY